MQAQAQDQILILLEGSIRLIDKNKTFGSLTLAKAYAPHILGIHERLSLKSPYEARANSECKYLLLKTTELTKPQIELLNEILFNNIELGECGEIYNMFSEAKPELIELTRDAVEVKKICKIKEASNMDSNKNFLFDKIKMALAMDNSSLQKFAKLSSPDRWPRIASHP